MSITPADEKASLFNDTKLAVGQALPLTPADEKASLFKDTQLTVRQTLSITPADEKASPFNDTKLAVGQALPLTPVDKINMVLNIHRKHQAYLGRGEGWVGMEVGEEGDCTLIATLLPPD